MKEPLPFIDAHFHLWDLDWLRYPWLTPPFTDDGPNGSVEAIAATYTPARYRADLARWNMVGGVHIEAGAHPEDALGETEWLEQLADSTGSPTAIVAYADLTTPGIDMLLAAHASHERVRGIRQIVNWHADPAKTYSACDITLEPAWERGFARLAKHGLSFDLQCYPGQMSHIAQILARHPDVRVIVNHLGMPVLSDPTGYDDWRNGLVALASLPQVSLKISGVGFIKRDWTKQSIARFVLEAIAIFGSDRAMFASDVPTDKLFGSVDQHLEAYHALVSYFPEEKQRDLFGRNANRIYRLDLDI